MSNSMHENYKYRIGITVRAIIKIKNELDKKINDKNSEIIKNKLDKTEKELNFFTVKFEELRIGFIHYPEDELIEKYKKFVDEINEIHENFENFCKLY